MKKQGGEKMTDIFFAQCMGKLKNGDMQGLEPVYREYGKLIYSTALSLCRCPHTAEDIVSDFFLKLSRAAHVYKEGMGHKKWLITAARNLTLDRMRKSRRQIPSDDDAFSRLPDSCDTEAAVESDANVDRMLAGLNEAERNIVNLKIYCGFTLSEAAEIMNIPAGTAAWRYRSALSKLKKLYGKESY